MTRAFSYPQPQVPQFWTPSACAKKEDRFAVKPEQNAECGMCKAYALSLACKNSLLGLLSTKIGLLAAARAEAGLLHKGRAAP
jgi:hypothetical protein